MTKLGHTCFHVLLSKIHFTINYSLNARNISHILYKYCQNKTKQDKINIVTILQFVLDYPFERILK